MLWVPTGAGVTSRQGRALSILPVAPEKGVKLALSRVASGRYLVHRQSPLGSQPGDKTAP